MSYPFQGGPSNHPYPPQMSYPSAPSAPSSNNPYPPYPSQSTPYPLNPANYPPTNPGYPSATPGYPPANPGYPSATPGYPPTNPGYPSATPGYPPTNPGYPSATPGYPPSNPGYPSATPGYPPTNPGYPSATPGYSPSNPGYPSATPGYPPTNPGYPPSGPGYPTQNPGYPTPTPGYPQSSQAPASHNPYPSSQSVYPSLGSHPSSGHLSHHQAKHEATVVPANPFNPRADAEGLRKAMKGFGTDEAAIIAILSRRTNVQRQEIAKEFKTLYGKDLIKDLKSETSGKFEQLLVALMTPIHEFYASEVHHALSEIGTAESTLIEVLCTLSNAELHYVKVAYEKQYGKSMESELASDTSGNFKRLLVSLSMGRRDENPTVNMAAAENDAQALLRAGELKFGTDESTFNAILSSRSFAQLQATFAQYERLTGHPFEKAVKNEFSGDIEEGLLAIVKCVRNKAAYLAECLNKSMAGAGTNDRALIRLMVTRSEIDLAAVKNQFQSLYGKTLESYIQGDASGDYKKLLLALLG